MEDKIMKVEAVELIPLNVLMERLCAMSMSEKDYKECEPLSYEEVYSLYFRIVRLQGRVESLEETNKMNSTVRIQKLQEQNKALSDQISEMIQVEDALFKEVTNSCGEEDA